MARGCFSRSERVRAATDGPFDSPRESFALVTEPLTPGKPTIEVLAFNAAGNKTVEKVTVDIPSGYFR